MIAIVDYGMGNLRSVQKAFARLGHDAAIISTPEAVAKANRLVLPGVGAMKDSMQALRDNDLVEPIKEFIKSGKPFFGICLGLQMLFDVSYEDGEHPGLGVFAGSVRKLEVERPLKVPHIGWNSVHWLRRPPIAKDVMDDGFAYFVHGYYVDPDDRNIVAAETDHGRTFASACWKDNVVAVQFHPEKSQSLGLTLLDAFARS
jgi:imidazole glycerol-phosphate synthase subunit HisH